MTANLYDRLGGEERIQKLVADIVDNHYRNPLIRTRLRGQLSSRLGQLHHIKRLHALGALGDAHGRCRHRRSRVQRAPPSDAGADLARAVAAAISTGRNWAASLWSTPLTYL